MKSLFESKITIKTNFIALFYYVSNGDVTEKPVSFLNISSELHSASWFWWLTQNY